ncbi:MAG: HNH endonuclease signature motif containing protein [Candidatus Shapirobacteria bacterium]|nr:HNH endonuclease signature motif containing protein [Candidatus Shapirobacteria bacterium]
MSRYYSKKLINTLLDRCNGYCECCGADIILDKHHILEWSNKGSTTLDNLICLCPSCHRQIPLILNKYQQNYLQTWHNNNIRANKSAIYNILKSNNKFIIGSNIYIDCKNILLINGQNIITPFQEKNRFYINVIMLENFEPKILILNNKLITNNPNSEIINKDNYILLKSEGKKIFELSKSNNSIYVNMQFKYKGINFDFNQERSIFPGFNVLQNCTFQGGTAISYND